MGECMALGAFMVSFMKFEEKLVQEACIFSINSTKYRFMVANLGWVDLDSGSSPAGGPLLYLPTTAQICIPLYIRDCHRDRKTSQ